jgi:hypothetical protein
MMALLFLETASRPANIKRFKIFVYDALEMFHRKFGSNALQFRTDPARLSHAQGYLWGG